MQDDEHDQHKKNRYDRPHFGTYDYLRQHQHAPAGRPPNSEILGDIKPPGADEDVERRNRPSARQRGRARGVGPKGYVRADRRILEEVCERLTDDPELDPRGFSVKVEGGQVILDGSVDSDRAKRHAEQLVSAVRGVTGCRNQLRII